MDCAKVRDRSDKEEVKVIDPLRKETRWVCTYPDSLERWTKDFALGGYSLTGEYEVDATHTLYRFELDETRRGELLPDSAHFHSVLIENTPKKEVVAE